MSIPLAVIGAGFMGGNHARVLAELPSAELVAVIDRDEQRARRAADEFGCAWATSVTEVSGRVRAVIVATPTETHRELALEAIEAGLDTLVEKPLAPSVTEAEEVVSAAEKAGTVLAVGHVERFNPACLDLPRFVSEPVFIQTRRISPFTDRVHEGVVRDMMIHDLDIVLWLAGSVPARVTADLAASRSSTEDLAAATVVFESGLVAQLVATRVGQDKVRRIDVIEHDCAVNVDLMRQQITIVRQATAEYPSTGVRRLKEASVREIPYLEHRGEPLWLELTDFVTALNDGRAPLVDGRAGVAALDLCERILAAGARD
jgi:predicted dehydrogenase